MRLFIVLLLTNATLNSACAIVNYSPAIPETKLTAEIRRQSDTFSFSYNSSSSRDLKDEQRALPKNVQQVKDIFEQYTRFDKVLVTSTAPTKGLHVNIYQTNGPPPSPFCVTSIWTFGIIPCYAEGVVYNVHFDLFEDNTVLKTYNETISRKGANWIGFLPFFWINFLINTGYEEAFLATVHSFISTARQDRLL